VLTEEGRFRNGRKLCDAMRRVGRASDDRVGMAVTVTLSQVAGDASWVLTRTGGRVFVYCCILLL